MTERKLIYADTVVEKLSELILMDDHEKKVLESFVETCLAVEAVPVVHGRWVIEKRHTVSQNPYMDDNYHAHATCSECGFCIHSENASFGYPKLNTTNYCPNCGAKMDGDGNDENDKKKAD